VEIDSLTIWARDKNSHHFNTFKSHTTANTTVVAIVAICDREEVTHSASNIIYTASINNPIINKWRISRGG
jgi:hypothetical protein